MFCDHDSSTEPEAPPAPVTKPVKKNRNAKMPKPVQPKKPIAVKAKKIPDKPKKVRLWK